MLVGMQRAGFAVFSWPKGRAHLWRLSVDRRGRRPPLLVYEEGWPQPWDNPYRPLDDEPRLYEHFAELGRAAFQMGARLTKTAEKAAFWPYSFEVEEGEGGVMRMRFKRPVRPLPAERSEEEVTRGIAVMGLLPLDEQVAASSAEDPKFQDTALAIVRAFGPLRDLTDEGLSTEEFKAKQLWLQATVSHRLRGISPILAHDPNSGRLVPAFSCTDLLSAMWLQFYESLAAGKTWRICKGCGRLFTPADPRQEYHDIGCRNRTHARRFGKKSREKRKV